MKLNFKEVASDLGYFLFRASPALVPLVWVTILGHPGHGMVCGVVTLVMAMLIASSQDSPSDSGPS